jgi:hypothetical protein
MKMEALKWEEQHSIVEPLLWNTNNAMVSNLDASVWASTHPHIRTNVQGSVNSQTNFIGKSSTCHGYDCKVVDKKV